MNWLEQFLLWITNLELYPGGIKWNVLGVLWLIVLTIIASRRFAWHFTNIGWGKPASNPKSFLWYFAILIFGFLSTFLLQIVMDEFVTVPVSLIFGGSWVLLAPHLGSFTIWKLIAFKYDSYLLITVYSALFYFSGVFKFYHFTKTSLFWLCLTLAFCIWLAGSEHVIYFLNLSGYARIRAFWLSYPPWRILTGFFGASIIKKPLQMKQTSFRLDEKLRPRGVSDET